MTIGGAILSIAEYWKVVRETEAQLRADHPGQTALHLITESDARAGVIGGIVMPCDVEMSAKLLVARTHRLANAAEIAAFDAAEKAAREAIVKAEYERKQQFSLPKEMTDVFTAAAAQMAANMKPNQAASKEARN